MADFLNEILIGVPDRQKIGKRINDGSPLAELVYAYNECASQIGYCGDLCEITEESCGSDLKKAIAILSATDQLTMLYAYCVGSGTITGAVTCKHDQEELREDRQHRHWVTKFLLVSGAVLSCMLLGGVLVVGAREVDNPGALATRFLETATEIFKLMFSLSGRTGV